jgi:D-sedoheptulose 7-phosphate isomerase
VTPGKATQWDTRPNSENEPVDTADRVIEIFNDSASVKQRAAAALAKPVVQAAQIMFAAIAEGHKILTCGNGGSAADAQHLSSELLNRFERERAGYAAMALTTDSSTLTSIANDYDYNQVFSRQVLALGVSGDVLVAFSTSGRSANITRAVSAAHQRGLHVVALTGRDGGDVAPMLSGADVELRVPADSTARIQETHIVIIHCLCDIIERQLHNIKG